MNDNTPTQTIKNQFSGEAKKPVQALAGNKQQQVPPISVPDLEHREVKDIKYFLLNNE